MQESEALSRMVGPGDRRKGKPNEGVMQILVTSACDMACHNCTQASNLPRREAAMTPGQFQEAVESMAGYFGTIGVFGGNPATSKHFEEYCVILRDLVPFERRGIWCNHPRGHGKLMRETFNPRFSNLNVHRSKSAYDEFKRDWPESRPFGLRADDEGRHAPVFASMLDMDVLMHPDGSMQENTEENRWEVISTCDLNRWWSAGIGLFRGELRGWFCEIAMAQSLLRQHNPDYPDTGHEVIPGWWRAGMDEFAEQARQHCHRCAVPLRGYGPLSTAEVGASQVSPEWAEGFTPKGGRAVELVTEIEHLMPQSVQRVTDYVGNAKR